MPNLTSETNLGDFGSNGPLMHLKEGREPGLGPAPP